MRGHKVNISITANTPPLYCLKIVANTPPLYCLKIVQLNFTIYVANQVALRMRSYKDIINIKHNCVITLAQYILFGCDQLLLKK